MYLYKGPTTIKVLVLGGLGDMGRAVAESFISSDPLCQVDIADQSIAENPPEGLHLSIQTDLTKYNNVVSLLKGYDLAICALPSEIGRSCVSASREAGVNIIDLSFRSKDTAYQYVLEKMKLYGLGFDTKYEITCKEKDMNKRNDDLRDVSGTVTFSDPLTSFLYQLMRDEVPAGRVEKLIRDVTEEGEQDVVFTNGWLAKYANNLAEQIRNGKVTQLQKALDQAFTDAEIEAKENERKENRERIKRNLEGVSENLDDETFAKLEKRLIEASEVGTTKVDKAVSPNTAVDEAKDAVDQLLAQGKLTEEDAANLKSDIDDAVSEDSEFPEAEEIKTEVSKEKAVTAEEAKRMVESAVEFSESVEELKEKKMFTLVDQTNVKSDEDKEKLLKSGAGSVEQDNTAGPFDEEVKEEEGINVFKDILKFTANGTFVDTGPSSVGDNVTVLNVNPSTDTGIKWKNTEDELKKIEEE